ncbi:uncharacterized protein fam217ba [Engraulis encrasicolus]|uniref:uncharacterized protein fam217ba n=1 Tax=Engraulis encrasicolus TaxID=184585 RepID=UPI002FD4586B
MGPIVQEQASTSLKRIPAKEKLRTKNAENAGAVNSSSKKGSKVNPNQRPSKRTGTSVRSGQDRDSVGKSEKGSHQHGASRAKSDLSPLTGNHKFPRPQAEGDVKSQQQRRTQASGPEDRRIKQIQQSEACCSSSSEAERNHAAQVKSRRELSLPLAPQTELHHKMLQKQQCAALESMHLYDAKEDDTDSASDLSDSERLPVLPSPCTPPQLNLRAEVINSADLLPDIPGPHNMEAGEDDDDLNEGRNFDYPDFLPPPFNTWSLRQLAVFLNTEGKGAPRPRPVGQLEKFLERLLQLEWHQIQTVQAESGARMAAATLRSRGHLAGPASSPMSSAARPRPHTAPPTRLNSPKSLRQNQQRGLPFAVLSSLGSPSSAQLSRPVCPYCHIRYPLCNGTCYSYAYHRHSRLSPLLERKTPTTPGPAFMPSPSQKRSSSESRTATADGLKQPNARSSQRDPGSPQPGKGHLRHMQATGNMRRASQDSGSNGKHASSRKGRGKGPEQDRHRDGYSGTRSAPRTPPASKQEVSLGKRCERDRQVSEVGWAKPGVRRPENCPPTKKLSASRPSGKGKSEQCLVK